MCSDAQSPRTPQEPHLLRLDRRAAEPELTVGEKVKVNRTRWRLRRHMRQVRQRRALRRTSARPPLRARRSAPRGAWQPSEGKDWAEKKFSIGEPESEQVKWVERLEAVSQGCRFDGLVSVLVCSSDFESARMSLKPGRAPGFDQVPSEFIGTWSMVQQVIVYSAIVPRIAGLKGHTNASAGWITWLLYGTLKAGKIAVMLDHWKPLCLCPSLFKLYDRVLRCVAGSLLHPMGAVQTAYGRRRSGTRRVQNKNGGVA